MSDYNTGKLLLIGKGLAPYRSYLVGGTCIFAVTADSLLLKEAEFLNIRRQSVPLIIKTEQEAVISRLLLCFGLSILIILLI